MAVFGRRWRIIAASGVIGLFVAGIYVINSPTTYTSHAGVQVRPITTDPFSGSATTPEKNLNMATELQIATSGAVAEPAAEKLKTDVLPQVLIHRHLVVTNPADTEILDFAFTDSSPADAQRGAAAFASAYLENRHAEAVASIDALKARLNRQVTRLLGSGTSEDSPLVTGLEDQINELEGIDTRPGGTTQQATLPRYRAGPRHLVVLIGGLFVGLIIGLILAFIRDATDDRLRGPRQLVDIFGRPVLARVPVVPRRFPLGTAPDLTGDGSRNPRVAEAYRTLASRLLVAGATEDMKSILIASPAAGEGRSSVAANLATTLVELGYGIWVVSADLLPPQVHRLLGAREDDDVVDQVIAMDPETGARKASTELVLQLSPAQLSKRSHHLTLVSGSRRSRTPGRLMSPLTLQRLIEDNQHIADFTIIDAPPLLEYADAVPLLPRVDAVLVVADASITRRSELEELADMLTSTGSNVLGSVLNRDGSRIASRRARRARRREADRRRGVRRVVEPVADSTADSAGTAGPAFRPPATAWPGGRVAEPMPPAARDVVDGGVVDSEPGSSSARPADEDSPGYGNARVASTPSGDTQAQTGWGRSASDPDADTAGLGWPEERRSTGTDGGPGRPADNGWGTS
jgi:Mrp family chromosome partitioning ATPase/capsular polysaccharide biosynthesis protein